MNRECRIKIVSLEGSAVLGDKAALGIRGDRIGGGGIRLTGDVLVNGKPVLTGEG